MRWLKHKSSTGFTLIEVIIVLAISSLLMIILFAGYAENRRRSQFTDAIERIVTRLEQAKTEATSTVNTSTANPGENPDTLVFAKVVDYSGGDCVNLATSFRTSTLLANRDENLANISQDAGTVESDNYAWGVGFVPTNCETEPSSRDLVVFTRAPTDGRLNTFVFNSAEAESVNSILLSVASYSTQANPADTAVAVLSFLSPEGLRARVTVDAASSEINREFLN